MIRPNSASLSWADAIVVGVTWAVAGYLMASVRVRHSTGRRHAQGDPSP